MTMSSEFYAPPPTERDLADPATDPPMTVRVERWADRYRTDVRRAVKTDARDGIPRFVVTAADYPGDWLTDDEVASWPVCPDVVNQAAHALAAGRTSTGHGEQAHERGDMGVEAFRT